MSVDRKKKTEETVEEKNRIILISIRPKRFVTTGSNHGCLLFGTRARPKLAFMGFKRNHVPPCLNVGLY